MQKAKGGSVIRNRRAEENWGTLGCVVVARDERRTRYILSAAHVIALNGLAHQGDPIEYFEPDEQRWVKIAEFERFVPYRDIEGAFQVCDAAIARVTHDDLVSAEIADIGAPIDISSALFQGKNLRFHGAGSGLNNDAFLHSPGNTLPIIYDDGSGGTYRLEFKQQILYGSHSGGLWTPSTKPMDSGALILDHDNLAVGLHIAGTPEDYPVDASVCTPIRSVLDALEVDLETGEDPAPVARDPDSVSVRAIELFDIPIRSLLEPHNPFGGVPWQLSNRGLIVDGVLTRSPGRLVTVPRVWDQFGQIIGHFAAEYKVPVELIVATICTESSGNADAIRIEPGYESDAATPNKVSVGLMQTLVSTAREAVQNAVTIDRNTLKRPDVSIMAGTAYIDRQRSATRLDPPQVACAYNAGHLAVNRGEANRWKMRQYPIGTGAHADRYTNWFNDCFEFFRTTPAAIPANAPSFFRVLNGI